MAQTRGTQWEKERSTARSISPSEGLTQSKSMAPVVQAQGAETPSPETKAEATQGVKGLPEEQELGS